jgi:hypothetical protein
MHPTIKEQQQLMQDALKNLQDQETIERLIGPVDSITTKVMLADLKNQYIEITQKLYANFLNVNNVLQ